MIDWTTLTILEDDGGGEPHQIADEDQVYDAMGFMEVDATMEAEERTEDPQRKEVIANRTFLLQNLNYVYNVRPKSMSS
jgi:hypothetical protein